MPQTLSDLQTLALSDDFDATKYGGRARQAILDAISEVARSLRLPSSEASYTVPTTAGVADYQLPSDFIRALGLYRTADDVRLYEQTTDEADQNEASTGLPYAYSVYGTTLTLYPTPNASTALRLRYLKEPNQPAQTDAVASTTGIPESYLDMLVSYARAKLFRFEDDPEMSQFWYAEFRRELGRMRGDLSYDPASRRQIPNFNLRRL
jgi:hypothetical protein